MTPASAGSPGLSGLYHGSQYSHPTSRFSVPLLCGGVASPAAFSRAGVLVCGLLIYPCHGAFPVPLHSSGHTQLRAADLSLGLSRL